MYDNMNPTYISAFQRGPNGFEIAYYETREQTNSIALMRSLIVNDSNPEYNALIEEAIEAIEELVEQVLQDLRNPPKTIGRRRRKRVATEDSGDVGDDDYEDADE